MKSQYFKKHKLPDSPGVYTFKDSKGKPLYIGRATSLRDRVKSYFAKDLIETRGPRIVDMVEKASKLDYVETDSVLEAVILESNLIKKYQPRYNVDAKDDKSDQYVVITDEDWPRVFQVRARDFDHESKTGTLDYKVKKVFGPYPESGLIKEALKILRKLFPFKDKKSKDQRHDQFYKAIGMSPDGSDADAKQKYLDTIGNLILFFEGKKSSVRKRLQKEMDDYANTMRFEQAGKTKRLLYALDHINDIALIKASNKSEQVSLVDEYRIEAYDIAHLSGTDVVGVMVVSINSEPAKNEYRKFKISREKNDELGNLAELVTRRFNHPEWNYPDLIVVDGNINQFKVAESVLKALRISIPVIAVTKDNKHKAREIVGNLEIASKHSKEIIAINAEAHRFALSYHRKIREKLPTNIY